MSNGSIVLAGLAPLTLLPRAPFGAALVAAGAMCMPLDVLAAAGASGKTTAEQFIAWIGMIRSELPERFRLSFSMLILIARTTPPFSGLFRLRPRLSMAERSGAKAVASPTT
jgi:hypothetical protein